MRFELHYDQRSIRRETVERIAGHLETLLESIVRDPFQKIASLEILDDSHRSELFKALSGQVEPIPHTCIHELFEQQAREWPQTIAVTCEDDSITYKELDQRANQLAHRLIRLGVGPEIAVGICLAPSVDQLVAILGVLKAGGFYVPLDPAYPHDRLSFILNDTGAAVLISERSIADEIFDDQGTALFMEEERDALAAEPTSKPDSAVTPGNLAYAIYTSGSTGQPKGVVVSHANLVHSTIARTVYYKESLTKYLLLSSFSFDSSVAGLFWTLCSGATLLLPPADARRDVPALVDLIERNRVSHLLCLPSLHSLLLDAAERENLASLRCVIVAGEACPVDLPSKHSRATDASLYNEYGPTEGTVWATVFKIEQNGNRQIPIGGPIANTQIYILDNQLQPVPFGVSGELFIGGRGITRGYLNRSSITAEKFLPDPFSGADGSRLYRTGDRVRCRPDCHIDFLGRFDQQVKLRGYRIELGEIEAVLVKHPQVQETVCLVEKLEENDERLLAFVVRRPVTSQDDPTLKKADLVTYARERLPEFMVPSNFILLEKLPLLPNGKLNRRALLESIDSAKDQERVFVAPATPTEELLAEIWSEVLKTDRIGIHDNFFDLGGHSFLAIKAHSRLSKTLEREIPLLKLFEYPTLQTLASFLDQTEEKTVPVAQTEDWAEKRRQAMMGQRQPRN
jgi:amino acid adenylation domain-containing protein